MRRDRSPGFVKLTDHPDGAIEAHDVGVQVHGGKLSQQPGIQGRESAGDLATRVVVERDREFVDDLFGPKQAVAARFDLAALHMGARLTQVHQQVGVEQHHPLRG